jgi:hypothetical protein
MINMTGRAPISACEPELVATCSLLEKGRGYSHFGTLRVVRWVRGWPIMPERTTRGEIFSHDRQKIQESDSGTRSFPV